MTALSPRINVDQSLWCYAGETLVVELVQQDASGAVIPPAGDVRLTLYSANSRDPLGEAVGAVAGDAMRFTVPGTLTEALFEAPRTGIRYQVTTAVEDGTDVSFEGQFTIRTAAARAAGIGLPGPVVLTVGPRPARALVTYRGAPGQTPWAAAGQTLEEYNEDVAAAAAPQFAALVADLPEYSEQVQVLANLLIPSGATAILADSGNAIMLGDML